MDQRHGATKKYVTACASWQLWNIDTV